MELLNKIKELCAEKGISQRKLESELSLGNGSISKWSKSSPSIDVLQKAAEYFNVSVDYLLYGFNKTELASFINITKHTRSIKEFSKDTGIDEFYLIRLCSGVEYNQPSIDTMIRIACNNDNDWIVDTESLFKAAGYILEEISGTLLVDIPLELLHHYQEKNMTETEMVVAYINFRQTEREDALKDTEIQAIAAHHDGDEWTEEEPQTIESLPKNIRAAARLLLDLDENNQKTAIDMINYLAQKGDKAKEQ